MNTHAARAALAASRGWFKSSTSIAADGCVGVSLTVPGLVGVRDTKLGDHSPVLLFDIGQWRHWLTEVTRNELTNTNGAVTVTVHSDKWEVRPVDGSCESLWFNSTEWHAFRVGALNGEFTPKEVQNDQIRHVASVSVGGPTAG